MGHLVRVRLQESGASGGTRNVAATYRISRQPIEAIDKAQHIGHEYVGYRKGSG